MTFDVTLYESIPPTNVAGTLALVRGAISASKPAADVLAIKKALKRLRAAGEALQRIHQDAPPARSSSMTRAADTAVDRIWGAVAQRLAAHLELDGDDASEAARLQAILFPSGMSFLTFRYAEQWAEGEAILQRIASEKLDASLSRLVGEPFLAELLARHVAYGEALGITKAKAAEPGVASLVEPLRATRAALATYVRVVVAAVDNGELDAAHGEAALAPVAQLRQSLRSAKKKGAPPVVSPPDSPDPLPPVD